MLFSVGWRAGNLGYGCTIDVAIPRRLSGRTGSIRWCCGVLFLAGYNVQQPQELVRVGLHGSPFWGTRVQGVPRQGVEGALGLDVLSGCVGETDRFPVVVVLDTLYTLA